MTGDLSFDPSIPVADATSETDDIIYRISHDLRASVRALQELPVWISEDLDKSAIDLPKPTDRHLELIASHASRLDLMLTGLLEYSRVGRMQPIAAISPADVLQDVIDDLALPEDVRISTKVDHGKVQMGHADLQRVFHILISNAVRFHPKQAPRIEVSAGPEADGFWVIDVIDDGDGIPENKRDFILRPMTKLVSRDVDPGAGMGLAVLRKIAWTYGGEVEVLEPKSGKGTHVRVKLLVN
ncbi:MAG: HAMP domain-containing sensor histidine kinase [Paracoccaceae bacterium]|nr:HAMP domain-containing sensor histidine kinase [Paracoccaceae bacterium]